MEDDEDTDHSDEDELLLPLALGVFPGDVPPPQLLDPHGRGHQADCALLSLRRRGLLGSWVNILPGNHFYGKYKIYKSIKSVIFSPLKTD